MPFRAQTIRGYLQGMQATLSGRSGGDDHAGPRAAACRHRIRFKYNQDFDSIYAMVPSNMC
jgi:ribosome-dependent ATPase